MKVTVYTESVSGTLNKRHFCQIEDGTMVIKREGDSVRDAAQKCISAVEFMAQSARRRLEEMKIL